MSKTVSLAAVASHFSVTLESWAPLEKGRKLFPYMDSAVKPCHLVDNDKQSLMSEEIWGKMEATCEACGSHVLCVLCVPRC